MTGFFEFFDIIVIGAGHAGIEASLACARLGCNTACFTLNLDAVANLPCNPAIGGTGKGQLVREIDALGGEMARAADACCIQYRMLNSGKGPAVRSLRAQADRSLYNKHMKHILETEKNLRLIQNEITDVLTENGSVCGVKTDTGLVYGAKAVIICTGTYLCSRVITGESVKPGGPDGMMSATSLTASLKALGLPVQRFKTGTPPRVAGASIDFNKTEVQPGDERVVPFSFSTGTPPENKACCYLTYTNEKTHEILRRNLSRSPLYSGVINGVGARYCPSIEDKVVRFAEKTRHQLFIEPMGLSTGEMYIQGLSSSMPADVQHEVLRSIAGFENAEIMRSAYAIEYDCIDPTALRSSLETKAVAGLYGAGQFNGTSGYEEAAAQGLVAGINAARKIKGLPPLVISRQLAYIGILIDDLVTKGTNEPYRMMTSRSEYRLTQRQDNADLRLMPLGHEIGLVGDEAYANMLNKYEAAKKEAARVQALIISPSREVNELLENAGSAPIRTGARMSELLRRPELCYDALRPLDGDRPALPYEIFEYVEIEIKYEGYIAREKAGIEEAMRLENAPLPKDINYTDVPALSTEARQKLSKIAPETLGQASRISGVSPADITALMVWLTKAGERDGQ